jgi:triosephosphate isomerase
MRIPFIAGNWKMNTTASEAEALLKSLMESLSEIEDVDVAVCPPFPYLMLASRLLEGSRIRLGAQNMSWEKKGAFTGEVSPEMLRDAGCEFVILGHSERRHIFGETDEVIHRKIQLALEVGLYPIFCVGETLEEREGGKTERVVEDQIEECLGGISGSDMNHMTIAYEPVWAIGTGKTATPEQAQEVHRLIRVWLEGHFNRDIAGAVRIQYGGSVKQENARALLEQSDIDGALVGGASLKAPDFTAIVEAGRFS